MPTSRSIRALVLERHNGPFILTEAELPTITEGQVLVRIKASGVNPLDTKIRIEMGVRQWERSLWK